MMVKRTPQPHMLSQLNKCTNKKIVRSQLANVSSQFTLVLKIT